MKFNKLLLVLLAFLFTTIGFSCKNEMKVSNEILIEQKVEAFKEFKRVLKPSGEVHIADWSKPTSFIMRLCFHLVQFLDGYKTTSANVKGKLPEIIKSTGFSQVEITHNFNSVLGTVGIFKIIQ